MATTFLLITVVNTLSASWDQISAEEVVVNNIPIRLVLVAKVSKPSLDN